MNCAECQDKLAEYLDGALREEEASALQAHLAGCPACQKEEKALVAVLSEARAPLPEPSELFWINFLPKVRERIASRPEPWLAVLWKPAVGWGSLSLATLALLAALLLWRMAPSWRTATPETSKGDYLSYETGYALNDHLAQVVETSKDKAGAERRVFEKLSPKGEQDQGQDEDLDNLLRDLTPEERKALEDKLEREIKELEHRAKVKEA